MKSKYILYFIGGIVILGVAGLLIPSHSTSLPPATTISDPSTLPGIQTSQGPWQPETAHFSERLHAIGLPALAAEGALLHIHQHLDIIVHGQPLAVSAGIGQGGGFISDIHTHDASGIIHVESPRAQTFTLGQFFDVWGVKFTAQCIGGYCADSKNTLKVYSNGKLYDGDPRQLALAKYEQIVVVYGTQEEQPKTLPTFTFPPNY